MTRFSLVSTTGCIYENRAGRDTFSRGGCVKKRNAAFAMLALHGPALVDRVLETLRICAHAMTRTGSYSATYTVRRHGAEMGSTIYTYGTLSQL